MIINYSFMTELLTTTWQVFCFAERQENKNVKNEELSEICVIIDALFVAQKIDGKDFHSIFRRQQLNHVPTSLHRESVAKTALATVDFAAAFMLNLREEAFGVSPSPCPVKTAKPLPGELVTVEEIFN